MLDIITCKRQSINDNYHYWHIFILFYSCGKIVFLTCKSLYTLKKALYLFQLKTYIEVTKIINIHNQNFTDKSFIIYFQNLFLKTEVIN